MILTVSLWVMSQIIQRMNLQNWFGELLACCQNEQNSQTTTKHRFYFYNLSNTGGHDSSLLSEDQFLCSICLDVFTDPVSTPCGHNFCKTCLTQYWDSTQRCHCPFCKENFTRRPELKINTTLREVVDHFKKKSALDKPEVLCDACTGVKQKALKSCLNCGATFCKSHLELHAVGNLRKHKLISPVKNLQDYICQKHERPLELFCRDDQMSVCLFCSETDHKTHNTVPIEEESGKKKVGQLTNI